jgi:plastocyanin
MTTRSATHMRLARGGLVVLLSIVAGHAHAGVVRGRVQPMVAAGPTGAANAYPGRANSLPSAAGIVRGRLEDAVIHLEGLSPAADSAIAWKPTRPRLAQKDQAFAPRVLPVVVGTTVDFPNLDPIYHNVFSLSPAKRFDLGKYPKGQSKPVTFTRPGLVNVFCDIHSDMAAFIVVVPNRAFAQPDAAGNYALPDVPAGRYTVRFWHPDLPPVTRTVQVPERGDVVLDWP